MNPYARWQQQGYKLCVIALCCFFVACETANTNPQLSSLTALSPLVYSANSLDATANTVLFSFSIFDAEDDLDRLRVSISASDDARVLSSSVSCVLGACNAELDINRQRPAKLRLSFTVQDSKNAVSSQEQSILIEPSYVVEASLEAFRTTVQQAEPGAFVSLKPELFTEAVTWQVEEWVLDKTVNLQGPGLSLLTLDAQDKNRHFLITKDAVVSLEAMTLSNGLAQNDGGQGSFEPQGGAIFNAGSLLLKDMRLVRNKATSGGAIFNWGEEATVVVENSIVGGTGTSDSNFASRSGGAIFNQAGQVAIYNSKLNFNTSKDRGGAIFSYLEGARVLIDGSELINNVSADGGAIKTELGGDLVIQNGSIIKDNVAILVEGGGVFASDGSVTIRDSSLIGNSVLDGVGGGIYTLGKADLTIERSRISDNFGLAGGGIYHDTNTASLIIRETIITANTANDVGGGVFTRGPTLLDESS